MTQIEYRVTDFDCPTCASNVERALTKTDGVLDAAVHFTTGRVEIEYDEATVDAEALENAIAKQGYTPRVR